MSLVGGGKSQQQKKPAKAIERLLALSESMKASDPERAMQIYMYVKRRANELMELDD